MRKALTAILCMAYSAVVFLSGCTHNNDEQVVLTELKVGKYYLETTDGLDPERYIDVIDTNTLQIVGIPSSGEFSTGISYDWNVPVEYKLCEKIPFVQVYSGKPLDENNDITIGLSYLDENTFLQTVNTDEITNAIDYSSEEQKEDNIAFNRHIALAHMVYSETTPEPING